jgi:hypothetical protein
VQEPEAVAAGRHDVCADSRPAADSSAINFGRTLINTKQSVTGFVVGRHTSPDNSNYDDYNDAKSYKDSANKIDI